MNRAMAPVETAEGLLREALERGPAFRVGCAIKIDDKRRRALTAVDIIDAVASFYSLSPAELRSSTRVRTVVHARSVAAYLVRKLRGQVSYPSMGKLFGGQDHTTCINAVRRTRRLLAVDPVLKREVDVLEAALSAAVVGPCGQCFVCRARALLGDAP